MAEQRGQPQMQSIIEAAVRAAQAKMQQQINDLRHQRDEDQNQAAVDLGFELRNKNHLLQETINQQAILQANLQANLQAVPPPQAQVPHQVVQFAYTPGTYGTAFDLIDYHTPNGAKIQKSAIENLEVTHDLDSENLNDFIESFRTRAINQGWFQTLLTFEHNGIMTNFIDNYGVVSYESVQNKVFSYAFRAQRQNQDSHNCFCCLEASLTKDARTTLYAEREKYTLTRGNVAVTPAGLTIPAGDPTERRRDGLLFLFCILDRTTAKTNATISTIVRQLNHLAELMTEHNSDITVFNTQVRRLLNSYVANKRENFDKDFKIYLNHMRPVKINHLCFIFKERTGTY